MTPEQALDDLFDKMPHEGGISHLFHSEGTRERVKERVRALLHAVLAEDREARKPLK
jgi:hypothetical protein